MPPGKFTFKSKKTDSKLTQQSILGFINPSPKPTVGCDLKRDHKFLFYFTKVMENRLDDKNCKFSVLCEVPYSMRSLFSFLTSWHLSFATILWFIVTIAEHWLNINTHYHFSRTRVQTDPFNAQTLPGSMKYLEILRGKIHHK